jgi:hypothetical protein
MYLGIILLTFIVACTTYFMAISNKITVQIGIVVNDSEFKNQNRSYSISIWSFFIIGVVTLLYYVNSVNSVALIEPSGTFILFSILFLIATIYLYSYESITPATILGNEIYDQDYKRKQDFLSISFTLFIIMSIFSFIYLYGEYVKVR